MAKKLYLCLIFFFFSPIILVSLLLLNQNFFQEKILGSNIEITTAFPQGSSSQDERMIISDYKPEDSISIIVENYLKSYKSPLADFVPDIISSANKYGVDAKLIIAIAQQESNLGKSSPENCFNAWGWGIHTKGTTCFKDWPEAIETVTKGIAKNYCNKGYCDDPCIMMKKYTPRSNGSWCFGVNQFLEEMETGNF